MSGDSSAMPSTGSIHQQLTDIASNKQVIGVLPRKGAHEIFDFLYVKPIDTSKDTTASPIEVHTIELSNLETPESIKDFLIDGTTGIFAQRSGSITEFSVIISTESGTKQASDFFDKALRPTFQAFGWTDGYAVYRTESEHTIAELTKSTFAPRAAQGIPQTIILLSGDGGTIDLVNGLIEQSADPHYVHPTIVPLPLGSGNALSNSYKFQQDDTFGLSTLLRGSRRPLPMFRATFSAGARKLVNEGSDEQELSHYQGKPSMFGVVVCSWGLHSTLVADSDTAHYRQFGTARFGLVAKELLFPPDGGSPHEYKGAVSFTPPSNESGDTSDRHTYVLASLVSNLEKTFCISPDSASLDGKMRLIKIPPVPGQELYDIMMAGYDGGKHIEKEKVAYNTIDSLHITIDEEDERWRRVCIDGKIIKMEQGGTLQVEKVDLVVADISCLD